MRAVQDTKTAIILLGSLALWQRLNVTAFISTGIASAAPEAMGEIYKDQQDVTYTRLYEEPIVVLLGHSDVLARAHRLAGERGLIRAAFIDAFFSQPHGDAGRIAFASAPIGPENLVGIGLRGPKKDVDKAIKGAKLHP